MMRVAEGRALPLNTRAKENGGHESWKKWPPISSVFADLANPERLIKIIVKPWRWGRAFPRCVTALTSA
jgi:hypothetical protein